MTFYETAATHIGDPGTKQNSGVKPNQDSVYKVSEDSRDKISLISISYPAFNHTFILADN